MYKNIRNLEVRGTNISVVLPCRETDCPFNRSILCVTNPPVSGGAPMSKELFEENELIFQKGDRSEVAYIIESGQVEIFDGSIEEPLQVATLSAGDIFGEMSLVDEMPRSHSARALAPVIAKACQTDFVTLLREDPDESLRYIRIL